MAALGSSGGRARGEQPGSLRSSSSFGSGVGGGGVGGGGGGGGGGGWESSTLPPAAATHEKEEALTVTRVIATDAEHVLAIMAEGTVGPGIYCPWHHRHACRTLMS